MAENEALDVRIARRWSAVLLRIRKGEHRDQVAQRILVTLQKAWQTTQKQLLKHGTSLEAVIEATLRGDDISDLYRQSRRHDYVKLFQLEQRPFDRADALLHRVVSASLDHVLDQFREDLVGGDVCPNVGVWNHFRRDLDHAVAPDMAKFAVRLATQPAVTVRLPKIPALIEIASSGMVDVSLLHQLPHQIGARQS